MFGRRCRARRAYRNQQPLCRQSDHRSVVSGFSPPQKRKLKYNDVLPNIGFTFDITPRISAFANYAKGLSVPRTDNLYNAFYFPAGSDAAKPDPETTDSFDGGLRYRSSKVQAQLSVWKTNFKNRTASAFDPELNASVFRNLGTVDKWGVDGSIAYAPIRQLTLYAFGSLNKSKIQDNIQVGAAAGRARPATTSRPGRRRSSPPRFGRAPSPPASRNRVRRNIATASRRWQRSVRSILASPPSAPARATSTTPMRRCSAAISIRARPAASTKIFPDKAPAYWLVNLDARFNMKFIGLKETYFQLNVYNLFDKFYVGGFGGGLNQMRSTAAGVFGNPPNSSRSVPRAPSRARSAFPSKTSSSR